MGMLALIEILFSPLRGDNISLVVLPILHGYAT